MPIDALDPEGTRKAVISSVSVGDSGCSHLTSYLSKLSLHSKVSQDIPCILDP